ncbi:MAG: NAD(P)H-dependent oxidoreductase [Propionibacteriaceae bacterium]|nr:NAD(P)H-dependent oxidoreductase [Propionibacteriaceae bacterium]
MLIHIVYAHPSVESFTHAVLEQFLAGVTEAGIEYSISDLYEQGFRPELTLDEYHLGYKNVPDDCVPPDVAAERAKLLAADMWAFVYPVWWTDCPAILKGWFDRVWTGFIPNVLAEPAAKRAFVLCTAGNSIERLTELGEYQAMETVMLTDRIAHRAAVKSFHVFDGSAAFSPAEWHQLKVEHLAEAHRLGREIQAA